MSLPLLFPFQATKVREFLEWKTDLSESYNGMEDSTQVRPLQRQQFDLTCPVQPPDTGWAYTLLTESLGSDWAVPVWGESQYLGTAQGTALSFPTSSRDYRTGGLVVVWSSPRQAQLAEISGVSPTGLTLSSSLATQSQAWVMPARRARVDGPISRDFGGGPWNLSLRFRITDPLPWSPAPPPTLFRGEDFCGNWPSETNRGRARGQIGLRRDILDLSLGNVYEVDPWLRSRPVYPLSLILSGAQEVWAFREWLHRRAGKYRRFWSPSWESELRPVAVLDSGSRLRVSEDGLLSQPSNRRFLSVRTSSGTWVNRQITALAPVPGNSDQADLSLDSPLGLSLNDVSFVSWLSLRRLASDQVILDWSGGGIVQVQLSTYETSSPSDSQPMPDPYLILDGLVGGLGGPYPRVIDAGVGPWTNRPLYDYEAIP